MSEYDNNNDVRKRTCDPEIHCQKQSPTSIRS